MTKNPETNSTRNPSSVEPAARGAGNGKSEGIKPVWIWLAGSLNLLILALIAVFLFTSRSQESATPPPRTDAASIDHAHEASLNNAYLEQMRSMTSLLKEALDLVTEQRREIADLRHQIEQLRANPEQANPDATKPGRIKSSEQRSR